MFFGMEHDYVLPSIMQLHFGKSMYFGIIKYSLQTYNEWQIPS